MIWIEAQYRTVVPEGPEGEDAWIDVPRRPESSRNTFRVEGVGEGTFLVRIRRHDDQRDVVSEWRYSGVLTSAAASAALPAPPVNLRVAGGLLLWDDITGRRDIVGYRVRTIPGDDDSWGTAVPAHEGEWPRAPLPLGAVPKGDRTFLVRAVDRNGLEGPIVTLYVPEEQLGPFDDRAPEAVETQAEATGWAGDLDGGTVSGGKLVPDTSTDFWGEPEEDFWQDDAEDFWVSKAVRMAYVTTFTPAAAPTPEQVLTALVTSTARGWRLEVLPAGWDGDDFWGSSGDDFWGEDHEDFWPGSTPLPWPGRVTNLEDAELRVRLVVPGQYPVPEVSVLTFALTTPTKACRGTEAVVGSPGPTTVTFPTGFFAVTPTITGMARDGAGTEFVPTRDTVSATEATLRIYDSTGAEVFTGHIDWIAVGG